jgi:hypothetical protein
MNQIIHPIQDADYRSRDGVSQSALKEFGRSQAHFYHRITHPKEATPAMRFGSLVDHLLFGSQFRWVESPYDDFRGKEAKAWRETMEAAHTAVFKPDDVAGARALIASVQRRATTKLLLGSGRAQVAVFADLPTSDPDQPALQCKGLPDFISADVEAVIDFKTTTDASPVEFSRTIINFGYDVQAAFYLDLLEANGEGGNEWYWIVAESEPPFEVAFYKAPASLIERGRAKYRFYLSTLSRCLQTGTWPGYPDEIQTAIVPDWALK